MIKCVSNSQCPKLILFPIQIHKACFCHPMYITQFLGLKSLAVLCLFSVIHMQSIFLLALPFKYIQTLYIFSFLPQLALFSQTPLFLSWAKVTAAKLFTVYSTIHFSILFLISSHWTIVFGFYFVFLFLCFVFLVALKILHLASDNQLLAGKEQIKAILNLSISHITVIYILASAITHLNYTIIISHILVWYHLFWWHYLNAILLFC